jgi:uncharacterized repeat protein (TIGR03943 family)
LRSLQRWRGVALISAVLAATLWIAASGQLVLYIHPRYLVFTVVMTVIALGLAVASALVRPRDEDGERSGPLGVVALVVAGLFVLGIVTLPATTLSAETASQRDITGSLVAADAQSVEDASTTPTAAFAAFTVVDWASLLRQTSDLDFYAGKPVDVVGFIVPDPEAADVFYVSRFVVTCCAVDAQPTGIPVYLPGWQQDFAVDDWVQVSGEFAANPSDGSAQPVAVDPARVDPVEQPGEPYLY